MRRCLIGLAPIVVGLATGGAAPVATAPNAVDRLRTALVSGSSATQVLTRWCASHNLANPAKIVAIRQHHVAKPADRQVRLALNAAPGEVILYRRVKLACGAHILSLADNWYRPSLLTPAMNRQLETTDTPFGLVVASLNFHRRTLEVTRLAGPLAVLRVRAVLITGGGEPFSFVQETYTGEVLRRGP